MCFFIANKTWANEMGITLAQGVELLKAYCDAEADMLEISPNEYTRVVEQSEAELRARRQPELVDGARTTGNR